jgi:hypothetical protein
MSDNEGHGANPADFQNLNPAQDAAAQDQPITVAALAGLINQAVGQAVTSAVGIFKKDLEGTSKELEELKYKKPVSFRYKGNEEQTNHNNKVLDILDKAEKATGDQSSAFIKEAVKEIKSRNKLVRFADSSEAGWLAVEEYVQNPLADDSDDDKKMRSAASRALAKKSKGRKPNKKPYQRSRAAPGASPANPYSAASSSSQYFFRGPRNQFNRQFNGSYQCQGSKQADLCFACGKSGHWRRNCPSFYKKDSR